MVLTVHVTIHDFQGGPIATLWANKSYRCDAGDNSDATRDSGILRCEIGHLTPVVAEPKLDRVDARPLIHYHRVVSRSLGHLPPAIDAYLFPLTVRAAWCTFA